MDDNRDIAVVGSSFPDDPIVFLDVGGVQMKTLRSTLIWSSTYFRNVLDGPFKSRSTDKDAPIFVDCDATIFSYVLHFMRHRQLHDSRDRRLPLQEIHDVAQMFTMEPLLDCVENLLEKERVVGVWAYTNSQLRKHEFIIYERDENLWYYDMVEINGGADDMLVFHEQLHKHVDGDGTRWYITTTRPETTQTRGTVVKFRPNAAGDMLFSHEGDGEGNWSKVIDISTRVK